MTLDGVLVPVYHAGKIAAWSIVDDEDYDRVIAYRWHYSRLYGSAFRFDISYGGCVGLHRWLLGLRKGDPRVVHHLNELCLDNRKANLHICANASEHGRTPHPYGRDYIAANFYRWQQQRKAATA